MHGIIQYYLLYRNKYHIQISIILFSAGYTIYIIILYNRIIQYILYRNKYYIQIQYIILFSTKMCFMYNAVYFGFVYKIRDII